MKEKGGNSFRYRRCVRLVKKKGGITFHRRFLQLLSPHPMNPEPLYWLAEPVTAVYQLDINSSTRFAQWDVQ